MLLHMTYLTVHIMETFSTFLPFYKLIFSLVANLPFKYITPCML